MDERRPKRRKDKDNPYTLENRGGRYYITFKDGQKMEQCVEINEELFQLFDRFELDDLHELNIFDRHMEHSEVYEWTLESKAQNQRESAEDEALRNMTVEKLHQAIATLPETQRRRLVRYYFGNLTYEQIAEMEGCSRQAVMKSVAAAEEKLKRILQE